MQWYQTAIMLEKKQFNRLTCNHAEINFYFKTIDETTYILTLVDTTKRYYYKTNSLKDLKNELERKFLLRGSKNVEIIFIIYTTNLSFYKNELDDELNIWLVDMPAKKLMIFENQPDDFLNLKKDIEDSLLIMDNQKKKFYPFITISLGIVNIAVFLLMYVFSGNPNYYIETFSNNWIEVFLSKDYYRLFTCMFLHSDANHLLNNMFTLGVVGNETEQRLGHRHFFVLYIISGLLSSLASAFYYMNVAKVSNEFVISLGASGAIFGIYGAYLVITLLSSKANGNPISFSRIALITLLLLFSGFTGENIDNMAHLAGLIVGIIISFIYCKCDKSILKYYHQ